MEQLSLIAAKDIVKSENSKCRVIRLWGWSVKSLLDAKRSLGLCEVVSLSQANVVSQQETKDSLFTSNLVKLCVYMFDLHMHECRKIEDTIQYLSI